MISIAGLVQVVIALIVAGLLYYVLNWAIGAAGTPEPFARVARVVIVLLVVLMVCWALLALLGGQPQLFRAAAPVSLEALA